MAHYPVDQVHVYCMKKDCREAPKCAGRDLHKDSPGSLKDFFKPHLYLRIKSVNVFEVGCRDYWKEKDNA